MRRVRELLAKAAEDFELAKRYTKLKEYATATLLYNKAIEKVLRALFIVRTRKEAPNTASIRYLTLKTKMPEEISTDILSLDERQGVMGEEAIEEVSYEEIGTFNTPENKVLERNNLARRLIEYGMAYAKI